MPRPITLTWMCAATTLVCCALTASAQSEVREAHARVPDWIQAGKVRAAYFSQWNPEHLPAKLSEAGFNSVLIQFCTGTDHFEKWARLTRENNLHFFAGLWLDYLPYAEAIHGPGGAGPKTFSDYRAFVHRDNGPHTVVLCPSDAKYWNEWVMPSALEMAKLSVKDGSLAGIIIDAELYGPLSSKPAIPASFYMDLGPCVCDECFASFASHTKGKKARADLPWEKRYAWVTDNNVALEYNLHLRDRVAALARELERQVHAINPELLLGFMNWYKNDVGAATHENYDMHGLREGLKTAERPVMIWTEAPEYESGYGPHTDARNTYFKSGGDTIYVPGLYLEEHAPNDLGRQVHELAIHSDGHWIFTRETDLLVNPYILSRLKAGNDQIAAAAPSSGELPFLDLWDEYDPVLDVNSGWRFRTDPEGSGVNSKWFASVNTSDDWKPINVGEFWDTHLGTEYLGVGWYQVTVDVPQEAKGKDLFLVFGGVDEEARVWINGQPAGKHEKGPDGWRERFFIPAKGKLISGKSNTITVRVSNTMLAGGIYLPVRIVARK